MTRTIFITGGRAKTGREVVDQLGNRGDTIVRAGTSQKDASTKEAVLFDWNDESTWGKAVEGADAIFLVRQDVPNAPELTKRLISLAPDAHVVLVSEQGADAVSATDWVRQVEDAVTDNASSWTLLRPAWFQQTLTDPRFLFLEPIRTNRQISLSTGGKPIAWVDTRDIADIAIQSLLEPEKHNGEAYTITGPDGITLTAVAQAISSAIGTHVEALDPPLDQTIPGLDAWTQSYVDGLLGRIHQGLSVVTPTVEEVTGRTPRSLHDFIADNSSKWQT